MKVEYKFTESTARTTLHYLRKYFNKPKASLNTLAKQAALRIAAMQAEKELNEIYQPLDND